MVYQESEKSWPCLRVGGGDLWGSLAQPWQCAGNHPITGLLTLLRSASRHFPTRASTCCPARRVAAACSAFRIAGLCYPTRLIATLSCPTYRIAAAFCPAHRTAASCCDMRLMAAAFCAVCCMAALLSCTSYCSYLLSCMLLVVVLHAVLQHCCPAYRIVTLTRIHNLIAAYIPYQVRTHGSSKSNKFISVN